MIRYKLQYCSNFSNKCEIITTISILRFLRVRPLSNKEIKSGDEMAVHFPGDGQIYVSRKIEITLKII